MTRYRDALRQVSDTMEKVASLRDATLEVSAVLTPAQWAAASDALGLPPVQPGNTLHIDPGAVQISPALPLDAAP